MNRYKLVRKATDAAEAADGHLSPRYRYKRAAEAVVDVLLPQVTTVEELEALPAGAILLTPRGELVQSLRRFKGYPLYWFEFIEGAWRGGELQSDGLVAAARGPLTVVWQP